MKFLSHVDVTASLEAMLFQLDPQDPTVGTLFGALKLALPPLWPTFSILVARRLGLRQRALQGCDLNRHQARRWLFPSPLFLRPLWAPWRCKPEGDVPPLGSART